MSATIEEAMRTYLLTRSAVTAITSIIRPDELDEKDVPPGITITVDREKPCNFLSGHHDLTFATITVTAIAKKKSLARSLSKAIANNGTNPGTGLDGCTVTTGDVPFDATREERETDFTPFMDGSSNGHYYCDSVYMVSYRDPS